MIPNELCRAPYPTRSSLGIGSDAGPEYFYKKRQCRRCVTCPQQTPERWPHRPFGIRRQTGCCIETGKLSGEAMRHRMPKRVRERSEAVARKDTVTQTESTVDPRGEAGGVRALQESLAIELRMRNEPVGVASVHSGLTKTMLEARVETQVHQVVLGPQRQKGARRKRALEKGSGIDTEVVIARCEASMELEKNAGVSMTKARRMIGGIVVSKTECLDVGLPRR